MCASNLETSKNVLLVVCIMFNKMLNKNISYTRGHNNIHIYIQRPASTNR